MRRVVLGVVFIMFGLAMASCTVAAPSPTQTIRLQASGDPAELAAYKDVIAAFEQRTPNMKVEFIPVGSQKDHMTKLTTGFSGGNAPDLFLINFRRFGQFAEKSVLEPVGPKLAERGRFKEADLYEPAAEAFRANGALMCVPQNISSLVVHYNLDEFTKAGVPIPAADWTWPDFVAAGKKLTRDTNGDGKVDVYGLGFEPTLIRVAPFVWQAGGNIVDDTQKPTTLTLDTPEAREALEFIRSWSATHKIVPPQVESRAETHEARFARGGLAMILHSRRYTPTLRAVPGLNWDVASLPRGKQAATVLHSDAYCLSASSTNKDAAYTFLEFAFSVEGASLFAKSGRTVPSLRSVAESPAFLDPAAAPKSARVFLDSIPNLRRPPNVAVWNEVETRSDPLVDEWFHGMAGKQNLPKLLSEATKTLFAKPAQ